MDFKSFIRLYIRSAAGIINLLLPFASFAILTAAGLGMLLSAIISVGAATAVFTWSLTSGKASRAAVKEKNRLKQSDYLAALAKAREVCDKLSFLRIRDKEISGRIRYIVQKSARYIELAAADGLIDPLAHHAMDNCLNIVNLYLKEIDDDSTEKRFGMDDLDPFAEVKKRTLAALDKEAVIIKDALNARDAGSSGNDQLSVMEDMQK